MQSQGWWQNAWLGKVRSKVLGNGWVPAAVQGAGSWPGGMEMRLPQQPVNVKQTAAGSRREGGRWVTWERSGRLRSNWAAALWMICRISPPNRCWVSVCDAMGVCRNGKLVVHPLFPWYARHSPFLLSSSISVFHFFNYYPCNAFSYVPSLLLLNSVASFLSVGPAQSSLCPVAPPRSVAGWCMSGWLWRHLRLNVIATQRSQAGSFLPLSLSASPFFLLPFISH